MRRREPNLRRSGAVACLAIVAIGAGGCSDSAASPGRELRVSGFATVTGEPDIALLSLGVGATRPTVSEARDVAARALSAVVSAVRSAGVEEDDVRTASFSIQPRYDYRSGEERFVGHEVLSTLTVTVRDVEAAGSVVDAAIAAGGESTRVQRVGFRVADTGSLEREARRRALRDATEKADLYAAELGLVRGAIVHLTDLARAHSVEQPDFEAFALSVARARVSTEFIAGHFGVSAQVEVVFAIE